MAQSSVTFDDKERIWSGPQRKTICQDNASLGEIIFQNMRTWPNHICQICDEDGVSVTFDQALTWAIRIAQFFKKKGLGHNDVIGIVAEHSTFLMPLAVACLMNGTPFFPFIPNYEEGLYQPTTLDGFLDTLYTIFNCSYNFPPVVHNEAGGNFLRWKCIREDT